MFFKNQKNNTTIKILSAIFVILFFVVLKPSTAISQQNGRNPNNVSPAILDGIDESLTQFLEQDQAPITPTARPANEETITQETSDAGNEAARPIRPISPVDSNNPDAGYYNNGYVPGVIITEEEIQRRMIEQAQATAIAELKAKETAYIDCSPTTGFAGIPGRDTLACGLANLSYHVLMVPSAAILTLSGKVFDSVIEKTVINMKANLYRTKPSIIDVGWTFGRDLINILFIFVLLYISINTIIKGTGSTGKQIANVLVIVVLINFSLFFTKVIIDISNVASLSFYNSITEEIARENAALGGKAATNKSIASVFIAKTSIATVFNAGSESNSYLRSQLGVTLDYVGIIKHSVLSSILMIVLAFVLFSVSILFLIRFVALMFVLITSSIAIGSHILPQLKSVIAKEWWPTLWGQSFFAPVFMMFLLISLRFLGVANTMFPGNGDSFKQFESINPDAFLGYVLVIFMLLGSLTIAKKVANKGSSMVSGAITTGAGIGLGAAAWASRGTLGRMGNGFASGGAAMRESRFGAVRSFGRLVEKGGKGIAGSSMDLRNSKLFQKASSGAGANFGKGSQDSRTKIIERRQARKDALVAEKVKDDTQLSQAERADMADKTREIDEQTVKKDMRKEMIDEVNGSATVTAKTKALEDAEKDLQKAQQDLADASRSGLASPATLTTLSNNIVTARGTRDTAKTALKTERDTAISILSAGTDVAVADFQQMQADMAAEENLIRQRKREIGAINQRMKKREEQAIADIGSGTGLRNKMGVIAGGISGVRRGALSERIKGKIKR